MYRLILPAFLLVASTAALSSDKGYAAREAAHDQAQLDKALAGLVPGKPQTCLDARFTRDTQRIGDTILYQASSKRIFRVDTDGGCLGLKRDDILISRQYGSQLCAGDILSTVNRYGGFPSGSCSFRQVVPYAKP